MTPIEQDKIKALCEKWGLKELNFTKGVFIAEDNTGITVNLRGDTPIIGITIAGELHTEGHGNLKVEDYKREIEAIMKPKPSRSSRNDIPKTEVKEDSQKITQRKPDKQNITTPAQKKELEGGQESPLFKSSSTEDILGSNPPVGRINKGEKKPMSDKSKLGTPDIPVVQSGQCAEILGKSGFNSPTAPTPTPKLHKAKCAGCKIESDITLDEAQKIYEEYGAIYCMKCRTKEVKHEEEHKKAETGKDEKNQEYKTQSKEPKEQIMKTCTSCGLELSGARALECFQKDQPFQCEDCEEKQKSQLEGDKKMDEKLPAINENKLTVNVIKQYICPTATDAEAYNFLQLCLHRDLNPFVKEAYLIKYGNTPATMVVGKDAFTRKAEESGKLDGFEAGIIVKNKDKQIVRRVGVVQFEDEVLVGGWAKIYRKDMKYPFVCEVPLTEYLKRKPDGTPQSSWAIMPGTMIRKVALVSALREGFTKELGGCYDKAEMGVEVKD